MTDNLVRKEYKSTILKEDHERQLVMGVVLEPETEDSQGDVIGSVDIELAAHDFMIKSRQVGLQHMSEADALVVESFIAPSDMTIGEQMIVKGAWIMTIKIVDDFIWSLVKKGEFTGFSVGGFASRS